MTQIEEMEIETHPMNDEIWDHFVHLIHLKDCDKYVLDLTGVQFGPEWPLLQKYEEYCKTVAEIKSLSKLGTNQDRRLSLWDDNDKDLSGTRAWLRTSLDNKLASVPWDVETADP